MISSIWSNLEKIMKKVAKFIKSTARQIKEFFTKDKEERSLKSKWVIPFNLTKPSQVLEVKRSPFTIRNNI